MSKRDMVDAYFNGRMDRRQFLKRMVSLGVSVVAAGAYAQAIAKNAVAGGATIDYGEPPVIVPINPAPNSRITDRTPVIRARVEDDTKDLRKRDIALYFDGRYVTDFRYNPDTNILTYRPGRVSYGEHRVLLNAGDGGQSNYEEWNFTVVGGGGKGGNRGGGNRGGGGGGTTARVGSVEARGGDGGATARVGNLRARAR